LDTFLWSVDEMPSTGDSVATVGPLGPAHGQFEDADEGADADHAMNQVVVQLEGQNLSPDVGLGNGAGQNNDGHEVMEEELEEDSYDDEEEEVWSDSEDAEEDERWAEDENGRPVDLRRKQPNRQMGTGATGQAATSKVTKFQPSEKVFKRFANKINVEKYEGPSGLGQAINPVLEKARKADKERLRVKDKDQRATVEQVMDPRTRMILFKLLNRGMIAEINGCISTGKEANVYHCTTAGATVDNNGGECNGDVAIKVYKTSILVFKDRDKYVTGEFRFRGGYGKKNPRKMVRTWAEKEMRNLTRLYNAGLPCPKPILLRSHVLLMSFLGKRELHFWR
jgi:RIO kinase 1